MHKLKDGMIGDDFRGSLFGESMDWGPVFCPSPSFYNSVTSKPEDGLG